MPNTNSSRSSPSAFCPSPRSSRHRLRDVRLTRSVFLYVQAVLSCRVWAVLDEQVKTYPLQLPSMITRRAQQSVQTRSCQSELANRHKTQEKERKATEKARSGWASRMRAQHERRWHASTTSKRSSTSGTTEQASHYIIAKKEGIQTLGFFFSCFCLFFDARSLSGDAMRVGPSTRRASADRYRIAVNQWIGGGLGQFAHGKPRKEAAGVESHARSGSDDGTKH